MENKENNSDKFIELVDFVSDGIRDEISTLIVKGYEKLGLTSAHKMDSENVIISILSSITTDWINLYLSFLKDINEDSFLKFNPYRFASLLNHSIISSIVDKEENFSVKIIKK